VSHSDVRERGWSCLTFCFIVYEFMFMFMYMYERICKNVAISPYRPVTKFSTMSLCCFVTVKLYHYVAMSLCHYVTMSSRHYVAMSLCHYVTMCQVQYLAETTFIWFLVYGFHRWIAHGVSPQTYSMDCIIFLTLSSVFQCFLGFLFVFRPNATLLR